MQHAGNVATSPSIQSYQQPVCDPLALAQVASFPEILATAPSLIPTQNTEAPLNNKPEPQNTEPLNNAPESQNTVYASLNLESQEIPTACKDNATVNYTSADISPPEVKPQKDSRQHLEEIPLALEELTKDAMPQIIYNDVENNPIPVEDLASFTIEQVISNNKPDIQLPAITKQAEVLPNISNEAEKIPLVVFSGTTMVFMDTAKLEIPQPDPEPVTQGTISSNLPPSLTSIAPQPPKIRKGESPKINDIIPEAFKEDSIEQHAVDPELKLDLGQSIDNGLVAELDGSFETSSSQTKLAIPEVVDTTQKTLLYYPSSTPRILTQVMETMEHKVVQQVTTQLIKKAATPDRNVLIIALEPKELGRISIFLQHEVNRTEVQISAERFTTLDMLQRSTTELWQTLHNLGYTSETTSLQFDLMNQHEHTDQNNSQQDQPLHDWPQESELLLEASDEKEGQQGYLNIIV